MPDDAQDIAQKQITLIPTDRVRILNPRVRNRRTFEEMVENIAKIGLKRPITVAQRARTDPAEYDLVCGQGRLEAFMELQQDRIPAIIIDADESDCLVMSLVENCARRQHNPIDLCVKSATCANAATMIARSQTRSGSRQTMLA
jgi:ParB family transcriptional regulator, chromosome partitioning protein